jgi:cytochrome P450
LPFPGPENGAVRALFHAHREDAHLLLLRRFAPARTLCLDTVISTADPPLMSALLNSRAHSEGRSPLYRAIAWVMPLSDGMLFAAGAEWARRHRLFTPLFQPAVVRGFCATACAAAARMGAAQAMRQAGAAAAPPRPPPPPPQPGAGGHYASADALLASLAPGAPQGPLGADAATGEDLLTLVRWAAMRTLLAWAAGLECCDEPGAPHGALVRRTARALDAYARVCFEVMPNLERRVDGLWGAARWLHAYAQLREVARAVRDCTAALLAAAPSPFSPRDSHLARMRGEGWALPAIASELNHLHGAHKAVAVVATAALAELWGAAPSLREALRRELVAACGAPPAGWGGEGGGGDGWRPPTAEDLEEGGPLPLLNAVWRETLRRHVVSMGTLRRLAGGGGGGEEGAPPGGLAGGSDVLLLLHALHHDEVLWGADAHNWEPARWDPLSRYWSARRAAEGVPPGGRAVCESDGPRSGPGGPFIPAAHKAAFLPFLDGSRRCAGMALARVQFAALLYALVVAHRVDLAPPCTPTEAAAAEGGGGGGGGVVAAGGGLALISGAACVARRGAVALVREPAGRVPYASPTRFDEEVAEIRRAVAGAATPPQPPPFRYRLHLVKEPSMFSTWEGAVEFSVA